jgi:hypothetical protein
MLIPKQSTGNTRHSHGTPSEGAVSGGSILPAARINGIPPVVSSEGRSVGDSAGFNCSTLFCSCSGDDDCNNMFETAGACGPVAVCTDDDCVCFR